MVRIVKRIKYIQRFTQDGVDYVYFRAPGAEKVRLFSEPGTAEFDAELLIARKGKANGAKPGTLGFLIADFKDTDDWRDLKEKTRISYERAFEALKPLHPVGLTALTRPKVFQIRDKIIKPKHKRWMANYCVTVLGILFSYAHNHGIMRSNPLAEKVKKIRRQRGTPRANRPWTLAERDAVLTAAPWHLKLPIALALCTGLRKTDILALTKSDIESGRILIWTSKRDTPIKLPLHPILLNALARRPDKIGKRNVVALQVCITSRGMPWTETGYNASWSKFRNKLVKDGKIAPGLTMHGGRHTTGTLLKEAGAHDDDIKLVGITMAGHYSREANMPDDLENKVINLPIQTKA